MTTDLSIVGTCPICRWVIMDDEPYVEKDGERRHRACEVAEQMKVKR